MKKNIYELKPHPRNQEFFDDIEGEKWDEFLESIKVNGVIEPILVTQDDVIVSGHQRVRALKEIGKRETVNCVVKEYEDDDAILLDLLEANIRRRGDVGGSQQKFGRRIKELERLYGVRQGSAFDPTTVTGVSQQEIAERFGMSANQLRVYKKLADMIPELSEALDAGTITQSTALAMMKQLTEDEQLELISGLDATKKYTERETAELIAEIQELKDRPAEVVETVVEKIPDDYEDMRDELDRANNTIEGMKNDFALVREDLEERTYERNELKDRLDAIEAADAGNAKQKYQIDTGIMFNARVTKFIEDVAGYVWLTDEIMELPEVDRALFIRTVEKVRQWAEQMEYNIKQKMEEN